MIEWALRYIRLGWPVIPLRGKLPLTEHGSKDATLNESQARAWWKQWPPANIGIATGHRFFVVDVDVKSGGEETWDMLRAAHGSLPSTIEQLTGTGGKHVLYALPAFPVQNSQGKIGPGIDIRGKGGYIVAAPSIHPDTKRAYEWDGIEEIEKQSIVPAPPWLLRLLQESEARPKKAAKPIPQAITEGGRNDALFRVAARLRRVGFTFEEIFASLRVANQQRCHPPLPDPEVRTIAESASKYEPDAKANLFASRQAAAAAAPAAAEGPEELTPGPADIEAGVDDAIARNDLVGAVRLAEHVATLRPASQLLVTTKLRLKFGKEFPAEEFARTLRKEARGAKIVQMPARSDEGEDPFALGIDLLPFPCTDSGNGERIVALYGSDLRYCIEMQKWLVWDGCRWAVDDPQLATQKAKTMARLLHAQATAKHMPEVVKWARTSESAASIAAALKRAATEKGVPLRAAELDQHPYLLNCLNGVVDLRTGALVPHERGYQITKLCHITYDPEAKCPRFLKFLNWAMGENPEADPTEKTVHLVGFLQRAFGYSLTADVSEKAAFVFWGPRGNNGKTTLLTTFRTLLSEYSAQISIDTLMTQRTQDAALRADLADLRGARLVTTSEVEKEHRLSEGKLKYITAGMGKIKSCRKYENPIEFDATHKIFMDCNHRPAVRGTDDAIWRRLKPVPFEVSIDESSEDFDKKLLEKLVAEQAGILAWAVRGCKWWLEVGLGTPPEISQANEEWRDHDDPLKEFLEDCCEIEEGAWCRSADLTETYVWWCKREHERYPLGREAFGERIRAKGFQSARSRRTADGKQMRTLEGLRIKQEIAQEMAKPGASPKWLE